MNKSGTWRGRFTPRGKKSTDQPNDARQPNDADSADGAFALVGVPPVSVESTSPRMSKSWSARRLGKKKSNKSKKDMLGGVDYEQSREPSPSFAEPAVGTHLVDMPTLQTGSSQNINIFTGEPQEPSDGGEAVPPEPRLSSNTSGESNDTPDEVAASLYTQGMPANTGGQEWVCIIEGYLLQMRQTRSRGVVWRSVDLVQFHSLDTLFVGCGLCDIIDFSLFLLVYSLQSAVVLCRGVAKLGQREQSSCS